jgi:hypothetical protein
MTRVMTIPPDVQPMEVAIDQALEHLKSYLA